MEVGTTDHSEVPYVRLLWMIGSRICLVLKNYQIHSLIYSNYLSFLYFFEWD